MSTHVVMSANSSRRWPWRQLAARKALRCAGVPSSRTGHPICLGYGVIVRGEVGWFCGGAHVCGGIRYGAGAAICEACWDPARGRPRFEETSR